MMTSKEKFEICEQILRILDGSVDEIQFARFEKMLQESREARQMYMLMLEAYAHLQKPCPSFKVNVAEITADDFDDELWQLLARDEMESPSVDIPNVSALPLQINPPAGPVVQAGRQDNRKSLITIVFSAAAILLLAIFIRFAPVHDSHGQITDSFQAVVQGAKQNVSKGRFLRDETLLLEQGLLEITMDSGGTVLVEAPAEIRLENDNQVFLVLGKMTAKVPPQAVGFTVRTPSASIVDYGTEFGVSVDQYANTDAHVLKGQVEMRLGSNIRVFDKTLRLNQNQAARASGETLASIPASVYQFTYDIPSHFEVFAKSLEPMMYFRVKGTAGDSLHEVMSRGALPIVVDPSVKTGAGPALAGLEGVRCLYLNGPARGAAINNLQTIPQKGDYTICLWLRFDTIGEQMISASKVAGTGRDNGYYRILNMNAAGQLEHSAYRGDRGKWRTVKSPAPMKSDTWYFVAVTNSLRSTKSMYINGSYVSDDGQIQATPLELYETMEFGGDWDAFAGFNGSIGDVVLFDRPLTEKEIRNLYESAVNNR